MPRIFDNLKPDTKLLPALRETLGLSSRADLCVGYFDVDEVSHSVGDLSALVNDLMDELRSNSERIVYGKAEVDQFYVAPCKPIIDEIDRVLAKHYGFTEEELDFIINYDIKYRMGREG